MKIGEAQSIYREQVQRYRKEKQKWSFLDPLLTKVFERNQNNHLESKNVYVWIIFLAFGQ